MPAVAAIASAPQKPTRSAAATGSAPPARAEATPSTIRKNSEPRNPDE